MRALRAPGSGRTRLSLVLCVGALAVAACAPAGAAADSGLVLPVASLPGLHPRAAPIAVARADLAAGLRSRPATVAAQATVASASATGPEVALRSDAFVFSSATDARLVLEAWQRSRSVRSVAVGDGGYLTLRRGAHSTATALAWRDGARIGLLVLSSGSSVRAPATVASEYAALADTWLRRPIPATAWGHVLSQIRPDGTVSKATALDAFAAAYGTLPGARPPAGRRTTIASATLADQWILSYLPRLTAPQRRAVQQRVGVSTSGATAHVADLGDPGFHQDAGIQAIADHWVAIEASDLNRPLGLNVVAGTTSTVVNAYADSLPLNAQGDYGSGQPVTCRVRVPPIGQAQPPPFLGLVLAHEIFHCFQFDLLRSATWTPLPAWVGEGTADWVALTVDPVAYTIGGGNVTTYIGSPLTPLFERSYDAVGFWGHVQDTVGNLWGALPAIITAGSDRTSFVAAGAESDAFLSTWGSSFLRYPGGLGSPFWQMFSPIVPPDLSQLSTPADTITGSGIASAPPYTTAAYIINTPPEEPLLHIGLQGIGRLSPVANYTDLKDAWFCTDPGGCTCPPSTTGTVPSNQPLSPHAMLALTGDPDGAVGTFATVTADPLSRFCSPKPSPQHGGTGVSNGDPYISTFDDGGYGFQTAGEFTLVKSTVDNLEIQSRQVPYPSYLFAGIAGSLAMNTAFAMRDGGAIVEVDKGSPLVLYIDHRRRRAHAGEVIRLPGGGRVIDHAGEVDVRWSDGTKAIVLSIADEGVNIAVTPSASRAGLLRGLLGSDDGNRADDFIGRDGHRYNASAIQSVGLLVYTHAQLQILLGRFGRSWRITQRQSLFVYPPGRNTRSYLVPGFPHVLIALGSLSTGRRQAAAGACRRAHVTNSTLLTGCEIDYGATGDQRLASSTGTLQQVARISSPPGTTGILTSPVPWTRLSPVADTTVGPPAIAIAGGQAVAAYTVARDAIEADTFSAASGGISGVSQSVPFPGWQSVANPALLTRPAGGVAMILAGQHNAGNATDPLNGTAIVARNADGSFGAPSQLSSSNTCCVASAVLAADGSTPLWVSSQLGSMLVFSGSTAQDLGAASPSASYQPTLGRDTSGRVWLAWYSYSGAASDGLYMMQLDPQTGAAIGAPVPAPDSNAGVDAIYGPVEMACGQTCRLLYVNSGVVPEQILSWAPGESAPATVLSRLLVGGDEALSDVVGAFTADGRLWVSFTDSNGERAWAKLGNARGAGGTPQELPKPIGVTEPGLATATVRGDQLVLAADWTNGATAATSAWATVVNPP